MANVGKIDEVVDPIAFKQVTELTALLEKNQIALAGNVDEIVKLNASIGSSKTFKDFNADANKAAIATERLAKIQSQIAVIEERKITLQLKNAQAQEAAALRAEKAEAKRSKTVISNSQAEVDAYNNVANGQKQVTTTINASNKAQAAAANAATTTTAKQVAGSKATQAAFKTTGVSIETLIGKLQVYKEIVNTTEDPAKRALYNSKIQETTAQVTQLTNVGKKGFDEFGNAVSKNTNFVSKAFSAIRNIAYILPGVGIAGLIAFATEPIINYISQLDIFKRKLTETQQAQEQVNQALDSGEFSAAIKNVNELTINIDLAKKGFLDKSKVLKEYNETIGKTTGQVTSLDQAEQELVKNGDAYIQLTLLKAAAQISLDEAAKKAFENAQQAIKDQDKLNRQLNAPIFDKEDAGLNKVITNDIARENKARVADGKKTVEQFKNIAKDFQSQAAAIAKANKFNFFGDTETGNTKKSTAESDALEAQQRLLEGQRNAAKALSEDQKENLQIRLDAAKVYSEKSIQLILNDQKQQLLVDDLTAAKRLAIERDTQNKINAAKVDGQKDTDKINEEALKELKRILDEGAKLNLDNEKKQIEDSRSASQERLSLIETEKDEALAGLANQFSQGIISEKEYNEQRLNINRQYQDDLLKEQIESLQKILDLEKLAGIDTSSDEKKLADLRVALNKSANAQIIEDDEKTAAKKKQLRQAEKQLLDEVFNFTVALVDGGYDRQKNAIQDQIDLIGVQSEKEVAAVNASLLSQQEKADKILVINATAQAQQEALQRRQRQLDVQKARFDKAVSIAKIIEGTAAAIVEALPNIPLSIVIGAIGAVQLATALATPIPKFEKGGVMEKSGLARYSEGGKQELMIDPSGSISLTPKKETVSYVEAGTRFISNKDIIKAMARPDKLIYAGGQQIDLNALIKSNDNGTRQIVAALKGKSSQSGPGVRYYDTPKGRSYLKRNV